MVHKANVVLVALMSLFLHAYSSPVLPAAPGVSDREQAKIMVGLKITLIETNTLNIGLYILLYCL
jgi:hypothetical protein